MNADKLTSYLSMSLSVTASLNSLTSFPEQPPIWQTNIRNDPSSRAPGSGLSSANLASWFCHEEREVRSATAHNIHETTTRHQSGGTGMACRYEFLQYAWKPSNDFRGLGRWCSWPFYCNPTHSTRIVVAYRMGSGKSNGLRTIYQQQVRYMQLHNIAGTPQQLFDKDLLHQCKQWRKAGARIILLMDVNEHVLTGKFNRQISRTGLDLEEFTHKCW